MLWEGKRKLRLPGADATFGPAGADGFAGAVGGHGHLQDKMAHGGMGGGMWGGGMGDGGGFGVGFWVGAWGMGWSAQVFVAGGRRVLLGLAVVVARLGYFFVAL